MEIEDKNIAPEITRKNFIKLSLTAAASIAFSQTSCSTFHDLRTPDIDYNNDLILKNCHIVDVISGKIQRNKSILINKGRIKSVKDKIDHQISEDLVIDINNQYIIPGLIDGHCHTTLPSVGGMSVFSIASVMDQMKRNHVQNIVSGITTVRDLSAFPSYLIDHIEMIDQGELIGPRIIHCGSWINLYGSHPGDIPPTDISIFAPIVELVTGKLSVNFRDTEELRERLQDNIEIDASFIKITLDDDSVLCGKDGKNTIYTDEHIEVIKNFSEKHDLPIAAHVHYKYGFDRAQKIPIQNLEHIVGDSPLSDRDIAIMANNNMTIVPTMLVGQIYAAEEMYDEMPEEFQTEFIKNEIKTGREFSKSFHHRYSLREIWEANMENLEIFKKYNCSDLFGMKKFMPKPSLYYGILKYGVESLLKMRDAGIIIGCGTDAGVPFNYHGTLWREMEIYKRIGFSNDEILRCATINNARILRMEDKIGSVETGKYADLVCLSENPLKKIEILRDPVLVLKEGKVLFSEKNIQKNDNKFII